MTCHGPDRKGSGSYPSIVGINEKYSRDSLLLLINSGRRMMPAFKQLAEEEKNAIASFVLDLKAEQRKVFIAPPEAIDTFRNLPYTIYRL